MAGIIFYYEDAYTDVFSGNEAVLAEWNCICKVAGITKAIIINKTDDVLVPFDADMDIQIVSDLSESDIEGTIAQIVCPWEAHTPIEQLKDFDHDVEWYWFGSANGWGGRQVGTRFLTIPQAGHGALHSLHVAAAVMFDRYNK